MTEISPNETKQCMRVIIPVLSPIPVLEKYMGAQAPLYAQALDEARKSPQDVERILLEHRVKVFWGSNLQDAPTLMLAVGMDSQAHAISHHPVLVVPHYVTPDYDLAQIWKTQRHVWGWPTYLEPLFFLATLDGALCQLMRTALRDGANHIDALRFMLLRPDGFELYRSASLRIKHANRWEGIDIPFADAGVLAVYVNDPTEGNWKMDPAPSTWNGETFAFLGNKAVPCPSEAPVFRRWACT